MIGIEHFSFCIPEERRKLSDLLDCSSVAYNDEEKIFFDHCGIQTVSFANDKDALDLACSAADKLFEECKLCPQEIDYIIYLQSRSTRFFTSSELAYICAHLNVSNIIPFTLTDLGCVNISAALLLSKKLLEKNGSGKILIVSGSKPYSEKTRMRYPVTVIGDAGMALLISHSKKNIILGEQLSVNGAYWDLFSIDYKKKQTLDMETCRNHNDYLFKLAIESRNRFKKINQELLQNCNLIPSEINYVIMQNINSSAFCFYEESLDVIFDQVCLDNLLRYGHLGSIDIMLNYFSLLSSNRLIVGDKVLIMNNSPVAAWCSILLQC